MAILTMRFPVTLGIVACVLLSGCTQPPIDQANLCEVNDWRHDAVAEACTPARKSCTCLAVGGTNSFR